MRTRRFLGLSLLKNAHLNFVLGMRIADKNAQRKENSASRGSLCQEIYEGRKARVASKTQAPMGMGLDGRG
jgi:hypothetical protein